MRGRLIVGLLAVLALSGCEYEEVEYEIGHLGKARREPFLAAQRFLDDAGYYVDTKPVLAVPQQSQMTVITPSAAFTDPETTKAMLRWVTMGGHLIVFLEGGDPYQNDWGFSGEPTDPARKKRRDDELKKQKDEHEKNKAHRVPDELAPDIFEDLDPMDAGEKLLRTELGVEDAEGGGPVTGIVLGRDVRVDMPTRFKIAKRLRSGSTLLGTEQKAAVASFVRGIGRVTIVADAKPFRNRHIGEGDNARLLWLLVGEQRSSGVWFIRGGRVSFFEMLWDRGKMAILGFAALLGFWLWKGFPRFGPLASGQDLVQRQFGGHLALAGAYLWHQRESRALLAPLRRAVISAAERRGFRRDDDKFHSLVAQRCDLPIEHVRAALEVEESASAHQFMHLIADLEKIRQSL